MTRSSWIWDRTLRELVPAQDYYARKYAADAHLVSEQAAPMIIGDIQPYRSVITGEEISGRRQHRDHLKAHGCVELGNDMPKGSPRPRRPPKAEVIADIKRSMEDESLRKEARIASDKAKRALAE